MLVTTGREPCQLERKILLNMKCLFWCLHEMDQQYNLNLTLYSLDRKALHPDIELSHLGDNLDYLIHNLEPDDIARVQEALARIGASKSSMTISDRQFIIGHYVQAIDDFGPIAAGSYGVISAITPELRGLFLLEGRRVMESSFAPSNVRIIFGTYIN